LRKTSQGQEAFDFILFLLLHLIFILILKIKTNELCLPRLLALLSHGNDCSYIDSSSKNKNPRLLACFLACLLAFLLAFLLAQRCATFAFVLPCYSSLSRFRMLGGARVAAAEAAANNYLGQELVTTQATVVSEKSKNS